MNERQKTRKAKDALSRQNTYSKTDSAVLVKRKQKLLKKSADAYEHGEPEHVEAPTDHKQHDSLPSRRSQTE